MSRPDFEKLAAKAEIFIDVLPEDFPVRGNAMASGDDAEDRKVEDAIIADLESGNEWAWCCVRVTAALDSFTAEDYLGCCSYESEADFRRPGGYFDDMVATVREELARRMEIAYDTLTAS